jgi:hypothetical protein
VVAHSGFEPDKTSKEVEKLSKTIENHASFTTHFRFLMHFIGGGYSFR